LDLVLLVLLVLVLLHLLGRSDVGLEQHRAAARPASAAKAGVHVERAQTRQGQ
jgi:hypothetical protein